MCTYAASLLCFVQLEILERRASRRDNDRISVSDQNGQRSLGTFRGDAGLKATCTVASSKSATPLEHGRRTVRWVRIEGLDI